MAFERGADAERDHRHARRRAGADDGCDLVVAVRKHHDVRQRRIGEPFAVTVLLADRRVDHRTVAEARGQLPHHGGERFR